MSPNNPNQESAADAPSQQPKGPEGANKTAPVVVHVEPAPEDDDGLAASHGSLDSMKRDWYRVWLRDKTVEKNDNYGFSSTGVSRTASPARSATA